MICRYLNTIVHTTSVDRHVQNYLSTKQTKCTEMDSRVLNHISNTTKPSNQLPLKSDTLGMAMRPVRPV